jgi:glycyl-tRNA synthetase beta chain
MKKTKQQSDFLLEIGCEEIPARLIPSAARELKELLEKHLASLGLLDSAAIETYGAPRRLAVMVQSLKARQEDLKKEILGPPKSVAFDKEGKPTRAAESFAEKQGIPLATVAITRTPRGEYLVAHQTVHGRAAKEILSEILPQIIQGLSFPRSMYWTGKDGPRFIRPIRWIVALLDGTVVPFTLAGVKSGSQTAGHRFLGKSKVTLRKPQDYAENLRKNFVLVDPVTRRERIEAQISELTSKRKLEVHADPELLDFTCYLNEFPTVIMGHFDRSYLDLPQEILITVMRGHQKYFAVESRPGELAPNFLAVINLDKDRESLVQAGHERVLRARFSDAKFFWQTDQKVPLGDYLPKLANVTYESRLGSYHDKVERVRWLSRWIAEQWADSSGRVSLAAVDRAAELAKCDLVTEMVHEFTELQGIVGGLYARAQGESAEVADAVYDHYRPMGIDNAIPRNLTGCIVSLADKLDSIVACFSVGAIPTGSSDPFALRRAALGIAKILFERKLPLSLSSMITAAARALQEKAPRKPVTAETQKQVLEFLLERARFILRERHGYAYDEISAVFAAGCDDLVDAKRRIEALKAIRQTSNFAPLAVAFKRIRKIIEKAGSGAVADGGRLSSVRIELFQVEAERELHKAATEVQEKAGSEKGRGNYRKALEVIAELRPTVDRFFDDVLVMAEEDEVRKNRLTLLAGLLKEFSTIADFSEIVTEEK